MSKLQAPAESLIVPKPEAIGLTRAVMGIDQTGAPAEIPVVEERPLTIYLNGNEIVTTMTIGDYPEFLALGFLHNQGMLPGYDDVARVQYDDELQVVSVHTHSKTRYDKKLAKKTRTSGCAVGTVFGDLMEDLEQVRMVDAPLKTSWLYALSAKINTTPSLYLKAGAIHGTVLCHGDKALVFFEDVGRHNAVDKVAGWMLVNGVKGEDKVLYTTGRLTSEMVIKTALMGIPSLVSRSGFTAWGVEIAQQVGMCVIGRLRGQRFVCLSGQERLDFDADPAKVSQEEQKHRRKGAVE